MYSTASGEPVTVSSSIRSSVNGGFASSGGFIERIGFKQNPFVTGESAIEAIAKICVELLLIVRDENHCNVGKGVEIVENVFFFEVIDFVEDDDIGSSFASRSRS